MRSWCAIDSSKRNSSSGTRRSRSRSPICRRKNGVARSSALAVSVRAFGVAERRVVDARQLQVGRHLHARERDEADAGVVHLAAGEHLAQLLADLFADAIGTMAMSHAGHDRRDWTDWR